MFHVEFMGETIMADKIKLNNDSLPPKVNLQNTDALKAGNGSGAPLGAKPITVKAKPISKSETAKIPLDVASSGITISEDTSHTKTIKIKPIASHSTIKIGDTTPSASSPQVAKIAKNQTSKIPLDAVMPVGNAAEPSGGPKTIRLKRPGETAKPTVMPAKAPVAKIAKDIKSDLSKTSRLDIGDAGIESSATPTRRKTIRVKRPTSDAAPSLNISRSEPASGGGAMPTVGAPLPPMPVEEVEEKCLISGIASILALFVVCTLIYVLMAQVTGRDGSLSKLSYFMPEVNLSWPGKIPVN